MAYLTATPKSKTFPQPKRTFTITLDLWQAEGLAYVLGHAVETHVPNSDDALSDENLSLAKGLLGELDEEMSMSDEQITEWISMMALPR